MTVVLLTKAADTATLPNKQSNRLVRSYPFPCTTTRVPPPTEPEAGITFIMATASSYVNKTPSSVKSWPLLLSSTVTELVPAAKADAGLLADRYQPPPNIFGNHDLWLHQF